MRGVVIVFLLMLAAAGLGALFLAKGAWPVVAFVGLEVAGMGVARCLLRRNRNNKATVSIMLI